MSTAVAPKEAMIRGEWNRLRKSVEVALMDSTRRILTNEPTVAHRATSTLSGRRASQAKGAVGS
jgi:hypothetical protein